MDQNGSPTGPGPGPGPGTGPGTAQAAAGSFSVFVAGFGMAISGDTCQPGTVGQRAGSDLQEQGGVYRDGFSGSLALQSVGSLNEEQAGDVLSRLNHLSRWVQAQQARVLSRMQTIYEDESLFLSGLPDRDMAFSLAAEEAARILGCLPVREPS